MDGQSSERSRGPRSNYLIASSMEKSLPSTIRGSPDFAGLQAALSDGKTDDLIFFAFDLLFFKGQDLRRQTSRRPQADAEETDRKGIRQRSGRNPIRRTFRERWRRGPQIRLPNVAGGHRLEASCAPLRIGTNRSWTKAKCRAGHEVVIGAWNSNGSQFKSLMAGVYRGDHLVYVGNIGTGYGAEKVARLMPKLKAAASENNP